jgi:2,3-dihydroxy-2,3-dihydro-p-cumate dehydrogenase
VSGVLDGRSVIVTDGATGIGLAISRRLTALRAILAVLPHLVAAGGRIVNIGAESVRNSSPRMPSTTRRKGGVHAFAVGLAREFASAGVGVNTVASSYTLTPELAAAIAAGTVPPALEPVLRDAVDLIPIGRAADPEEVAGTVAHLLRPEARFVTGQTISVHGGSSMA